MTTQNKTSPILNLPIGQKPDNTKIIYQNEQERCKFKERVRFDSWKDKAHFYFDKIWREAKILTRDEAYQWLSEKLRLPKEKTHFQYLNGFYCADAIWFCQQLLNDNRRCDLDFGADPITPYYELQ